MCSKSLMTTCGVCLVAAGTILTMTMAAPSAQRRRADNASEGMPVATNVIVQNPDAYYGKLVTVSAGVDQILSKTAFVIDQRKAVGATEVKAIGTPILVIAPYLTGPLDQKTYLLVRGQIVKFDPAAVARVEPAYRIDFAPEVGAKFQGQPVLVATSVVNAAFTELAKKPLPPPGPEEVVVERGDEGHRAGVCRAANGRRGNEDGRGGGERGGTQAGVQPDRNRLGQSGPGIRSRVGPRCPGPRRLNRAGCRRR